MSGIEDKAFIGLEEKDLINAITGVRLYLSFGLMLNTIFNPSESTKQPLLAAILQEEKSNPDWQNLLALEKRMYTQLCNLRKKAAQRDSTSG